MNAVNSQSTVATVGQQSDPYAKDLFATVSEQRFNSLLLAAFRSVRRSAAAGECEFAVARRAAEAAMQALANRQHRHQAALAAVLMQD